MAVGFGIPLAFSEVLTRTDYRSPLGCREGREAPSARPRAAGE